jgi:hypothetical protein
MSVQSQSLSNRATTLEKQLMLHRQRVRILVGEINGKIAARLVSPGTLLAGVGIGVAVEQASHHRAWSLATALDTASAFIGLLLSLSPPAQQASKNADGLTRDFAQR